LAITTAKLDDIEAELVALRNARPQSAGTLPGEYTAALTAVTTQFDRLVTTYRAVIDQYVAASLTSKIQITAGPSLVEQAGMSVTSQVLVIVLLAFGGGVLTVVLIDFVRGSLAGIRAEN
jgi:uncharacterized protein involved in exopolysaccharide biosynthesis